MADSLIYERRATRSALSGGTPLRGFRPAQMQRRRGRKRTLLICFSALSAPLRKKDAVRNGDVLVAANAFLGQTKDWTV